MPTRRPGPTRRSTASPDPSGSLPCSHGPDIEKVQEIFVNVLGFYLVEHVIMEDGNRPRDLAILLAEGS